MPHSALSPACPYTWWDGGGGVTIPGDHGDVGLRDVVSGQGGGVLALGIMILAVFANLNAFLYDFMIQIRLNQMLCEIHCNMLGKSCGTPRSVAEHRAPFLLYITQATLRTLRLADFS